MNLKKVLAGIKRNKKFLITTHTSLEGDAIGSELSFYRLLKKLGKSAFIVNQDPIPYGYDFLPGVGMIRRFKKESHLLNFDCLVFLDCAEANRSGEVYKINRKNKPIINIDHHISNVKFGEINWIDTQASSCCEMIYRLYKELNVAIDKCSALSLYTGILSDTGSFHYSNTSAFTHKMASDLLRHNLDVAGIYRKVYANIPFADIMLLAKILPAVKIELAGQVAYFTVSAKLLKKHKETIFDLSESILNFGRSIQGVEVVVLFKENLGVKDEIRVNFRSHGKVNVNRIANFFGGGGHRTASGCTLNGSLKSVSKRVLSKIREAL